MRTKVFNVPADSMVEFAELLEEGELEGSIIGTEDESEIKVRVNYERENRTAILDIMEMLENADAEDEE